MFAELAATRVARTAWPRAGGPEEQIRRQVAELQEARPVLVRRPPSPPAPAPSSS